MACFRRCYGETYPNDDFYDVARLAQRITSGSLRSVVAIADDGTLVGHTGLTVRHAGANAIEAGNTVVDPACRGQGLLGQLGAALTKLCVGAGHLAYLHYPTCAHEIMQKGSVRSGFETGVMLDYIPAETDYREIDQGDGRIAATVVYQPFAPAPHRNVTIASRYFDVAQQLYDCRGPGSLRAGCQRARTVAIDRTDRIVQQASGPAATYTLTQSAPTSSARSTAASHGDAAVVHVDLCLDDPGVGVAVDELRRQGYLLLRAVARVCAHRRAAHAAARLSCRNVVHTETRKRHCGGTVGAYATRTRYIERRVLNRRSVL